MSNLLTIWTSCLRGYEERGLLGILVSPSVLIFLAYRGWSVLLLAPAASLIAVAFAGEPLLAHWTQTFMGSAARFVAQFFPIFLLGTLFGKLMNDSGSVTAVAGFMTRALGPHRAMLAVVLAGASTPSETNAGSGPPKPSASARLGPNIRPGPFLGGVSAEGRSPMDNL